MIVLNFSTSSSKKKCVTGAGGRLNFSQDKTLACEI